MIVVPRTTNGAEYFPVRLQNKLTTHNMLRKLGFPCLRQFVGITMLVKRRCFRGPAPPPPIPNVKSADTPSGDHCCGDARRLLVDAGSDGMVVIGAALARGAWRQGQRRGAVRAAATLARAGIHVLSYSPAPQ